MHIMSRKEETGDVGQAEIAGNFDTRFIYRKEEKVQTAAEAGTGETYRNKKNRPGIRPGRLFILSAFCKALLFFN